MATHDWREAPSESKVVGGIPHLVWVCSKCGWLKIVRLGGPKVYETFYKPQKLTLNPYAIKDEPPCPPPEHIGQTGCLLSLLVVIITVTILALGLL